MVWFILDKEKRRREPHDKVTMRERLVALESKYECLIAQNGEMFNKLFLDNGQKSIVSTIHLHEDNIAENREAIIKLEEEAKDRFDKIDNKLDHIHECIEKAKIFNVLTILEGVFSFGKTTGGKIIRVILILSLGGTLSPIFHYLVQEFVYNVYPPPVVPSQPNQ